MNFKYVVPLAVFQAIIASCSNKPSISNVEQNLKDQISQECEGRIELVSIQKTNGVDKTAFGQKIYTVSYEATLKFKMDCYMYWNKSGYGPMFESFRTYKDVPDFNPSLQMQIGRCKKNDEFTYQGSANYFETEEGWILSN